MNKQMPANQRQVGGNHYRNAGGLQHWDVVAQLEWDYFIASATKYLWRLGKKGTPEDAIKDISKAIHFLEKKRELMIDARFAQQEEGAEPDRSYVNQD